MEVNSWLLTVKFDLTKQDGVEDNEQGYVKGPVILIMKGKRGSHSFLIVQLYIFSAEQKRYFLISKYFT